MADLKDLTQFGTKQQQDILKAVFTVMESKKVNGNISSIKSYIKEKNNGSTKR